MPKIDYILPIVKDRKGKVLKEGDSVIWYDPEEEARDLGRVYKVCEVSDEVVLIADDDSEAEVFPEELEIV